MNVAIARGPGGKYGVGMYVPPNTISNDAIETIFALKETLTDKKKPVTAENIKRLTGIEFRHYISRDQENSDLFLKAGQIALDRAGLQWNDIDVYELGATGPENNFTSTICQALSKVDQTGYDSKICSEATDVCTACTSSIYAIVGMVRALLCTRRYRYGMAGGSEVMSRMNSLLDANDAFWGDGAGVLVAEKTEEDRGFIAWVLGSRPDLAHYTHSYGKGTRFNENGALPRVEMMGHEIYEFVLQTVPELIEQTITETNIELVARGQKEITKKDIKLFALHQANLRAIEHMVRHDHFSKDQIYTNIDKYGNTSSASMPMVLTEAIEKGMVGAGDLVMLVGFGAGMTYGATVLRL